MSNLCFELELKNKLGVDINKFKNHSAASRANYL